MSRPKIVIYGSTDLSLEHQSLVKALTRNLVMDPTVVIVSGGFEIFADHPERISVDVCVRDAASESLSRAEFENRFETWLPAEDKDRKHVQRFEAGTVHRMNGLTHQARRFGLVLSVDAIVTVSGDGNTRTVLELAYAVDKPALPLKFTGKDSEWFWQEYRQQVRDRFGLSNAMTQRLESGPEFDSEENVEEFAAEVASVVISAAQEWRCLVLMPYGGNHDIFYDHEIVPAIREAGFRPHRIDRDDHAGRIFELLRSHLEDARAVIVDTTGLNSNVMYELGYANALGIRPLIFSRDPIDASGIQQLPFYLSENKMVVATAPGEELKTRIKSFLFQLSPHSMRFDKQ